MEKFHTNQLGLEDAADVISVDSVLADEPLKDAETLWSELANTAFLKRLDEGLAAFLTRQTSLGKLEKSNLDLDPTKVGCSAFGLTSSKTVKLIAVGWSSGRFY